MKKIYLFALVSAFVCLSFSANAQNTVDSTAIDLSAVDSTAIDSVAVDSTVAQSKFYVQAGFGANFACDNFTTDHKLIGVTTAFDFAVAFGYRPVGGLDLRIGYQGFKYKRDGIKANWNFAHFDVLWGITEMKKTYASCQHFVARPYATIGGGFADKESSFAYGIGLVIGGRFNYNCELVVDARAVKLTNGEIFVGGLGICGNASATLNFIYHF